MDRQKIIYTLEQNLKLDNEWIRYIIVKLRPEKACILLCIISCGEVCYLSDRDADHLIGISRNTFRKHSKQLIEMGLITCIKGRARFYATEYKKNIDRIADIIFEGKICCAEVKADIPVSAEKRRKNKTSTGSNKIPVELDKTSTGSNKIPVTGSNKTPQPAQIRPHKDINIKDINIKEEKSLLESLKNEEKKEEKKENKTPINNAPIKDFREYVYGLIIRHGGRWPPDIWKSLDYQQQEQIRNWGHPRGLAMLNEYELRKRLELNNY